MQEATDIQELDDSIALEGDVDVQDEDDAPDKIAFSIYSYGTDFDVHGLVRRINSEEIYIPDFQRSFVWSIEQASRLIESMLLGLPVPAIFMSKDEEKKLLVIDGQQRLKTLQYFYSGKFGDRENSPDFKLTGLDEGSPFAGKTYNTLRSEDRRQLDNYPLHAIIVRQDEPRDDDSSIYYIFERLNTGGTKLLPQEIRTAFYHGPFNDLLQALNNNRHWRVLFGSRKPHKNLKDQEFILRFFALYYDSGNYDEPMKGFLNDFMSRNRYLQRYSGEALTKLFVNTVDVIYRCLHGRVGTRAFRPAGRLNVAAFEAIVVGVTRRLESGEISDCDAFLKAYERLVHSDEFGRVTSVGTADKDKVGKRIDLAISAFENIR